MSDPVSACHAADRLAGLQGLFDKAVLQPAIAFLRLDRRARGVYVRLERPGPLELRACPELRCRQPERRAA